MSTYKNNPTGNHITEKQTGTVYLIGAGPGTTDLLTLRAMRTLQSADVIISDYLVPQSVLQDLGIHREGRILIQLKEGKGRLKQNEIDDLLVFHARQGRTVARLKSGDPFIYGRGQEEAEHLTHAGIPWQVIPGISSGAALSLANLPLTQRGTGRSFAFVTARLKQGKFNESFPHADTLVLYMGQSALPQISERLQLDGWSDSTPVALLERLSHAWERRAFGTLRTIAAVSNAKYIQSPVLIVVGAAAKQDHVFQNQTTVLFTGLDPEKFRSLGQLLHWPALEDKTDETGYRFASTVIRNLREQWYDWIVFTSKQGVASFVNLLRSSKLDSRILGGVKLLADSPATAEALKRHHLLADRLPDAPGAAGLVQVLQSERAQRVLIVKGSHSPGGLLLGLEAFQISHNTLSLHSLQPHSQLGKPLPDYDAVYFVSPAAVRIYFHHYGAAIFKRDVLCLGPAVLQEVQTLGGQGRIVLPGQNKIAEKRLAS